MRVLRWTLGIAVAVVLLAVAAALIATLVIDPDRYRGEIESAVRRETGRPFVLEGHLQLTWFPWLGVRTGAARLGNPPGAGGPDLLDWQSAQVRVRLLPLLLHRQLEAGRIRIVGADLHLRRGPHGVGSWDDLLARLHSGTQASAASPATWAGIDLIDSSLEYTGEHGGQRASLADWQLSAGPWRPGAPLSVRTSFVLRGRTAGAGAGGLTLPAAGVHVSLDAPRLRLDASPLRVTAPQLTLRIANAQLESAFDAGRDGAGRLTASGSLTAHVSSLRKLIRAIGIGMPLPRSPAALGALSLSGNWNYRNGSLAMRPLAVGLDSTRITGWVAHSGNAWTFALRADQIDFGRYLTQSRGRKPLELPVSTLRALRARGTLELDRAQIGGTTLEHVRLQVQ